MVNLFEDKNDYMEEDLAMFIANQVLFKISKAHPDWTPNSSLLGVSLKGYDSTNTLGSTLFGRDVLHHEAMIQIEVSQYVLKNGLEELFENTFAHEYCHYLVDVEMLNDKRLNIWADEEHGEKVFPTKEIEDYYRADDGHGECWLKYAAEVTRILGLTYPIQAHPGAVENAIYAARNKDEVALTIGCSNGDIDEIELYEKTPRSFLKFKDMTMVKVIVAIIMHDAPCPKECGGHLEIKWANDKIEDDYMMELMPLIKEIVLDSLLSKLGN